MQQFFFYLVNFCKYKPELKHYKVLFVEQQKKLKTLDSRTWLHKKTFRLLIIIKIKSRN